MGYHDAYYHAANGKIYATLDNYVVKCNATTGAKEASAKVCAPSLGTMRITGDATTIYVSSRLDYSLNKTAGGTLPATSKQIFNVDPTTLVATNVLKVDDTIQTYFAGSVDVSYPHWGPGAMKVLNGYLYFVYVGANGGYAFCRVSLTNPTTDNEIVPGFQPGAAKQYAEGFDMASILGTDYFWIPSADTSQITYGNVVPAHPLTVFVTIHAPVVAGQYPTSCVYVPASGLVYGVCGTDTLFRYNSTTNILTALDLGTVITGGMPCRIRVSPLDGKLYIPCQIEDQIIVWDTSTETGIVKTGFDSPIDVVFTASKSFAVQSGVTPLKEIT